MENNKKQPQTGVVATNAQTTTELTRTNATALARAARIRAKHRKPFDADMIYRNALIELKMIIEGEYGSSAKFCEEVGIDRFNLSKCWPKPIPSVQVLDINNPTDAELAAIEQAKLDARPKKEMSVGLYSRICLALGLLDNHNVSDEQLNLDSSLREYLLVNNNGIMTSIVQLTNLV